MDGRHSNNDRNTRRLYLPLPKPHNPPEGMLPGKNLLHRCDSMWRLRTRRRDRLPMKCQFCGKETNEPVDVCYDCFFKEIMWQFKDNPNVKEDIKYEKQADGTYKEIPIIRGLKVK